MDKAFIIDLEGTLVSSGTPLPGSIAFIDFLNNNNIPYCIITNTVSKTVKQMEENLKNNRINILQGHLVNPITVLNNYMVENNIQSYYFVGPEYLKELIIESNACKKTPEYIIFCDFEAINCNYELLNKIFQHIKNGSKMLATSYSNYYILKNEYKMDTGIFVKMYETLLNEKAVLMGKPSPLIYKMALNVLKTNPIDTIAVGDDVLTDIVGGKEIGIETILVKSGKYVKGDEEKNKPNIVINNLEEIIKLLMYYKERPHCT
jgi:HAD superfamily hydrolase (TIGR01450 family)